jgi:hypothetical protein
MQTCPTCKRSPGGTIQYGQLVEGKLARLTVGCCDAGPHGCYVCGAPDVTRRLISAGTPADSSVTTMVCSRGPCSVLYRKAAEQVAVERGEPPTVPAHVMANPDRPGMDCLTIMPFCISCHERATIRGSRTLVVGEPAESHYTPGGSALQVCLPFCERCPPAITLDRIRCVGCGRRCAMDDFHDVDGAGMDVHVFSCDADSCARLALRIMRYLGRREGAEPTPRCSSCRKVTERSMVCGRCRVTPYCSKECQRAAWSKHKEVCKAPS